MRPRHDDPLQQDPDDLLARNFVRRFGESREEERREPVGVRVGVSQLVRGGSDDKVASYKMWVSQAQERERRGKNAPSGSISAMSWRSSKDDVDLGSNVTWPVCALLWLIATTPV